MDTLTLIKINARWRRMLRTRCTCEETELGPVECAYHAIDKDKVKALPHLYYGRYLAKRLIEEEFKEAS
jgi:hypothetical protein